MSNMIRACRGYFQMPKYIVRSGSLAQMAASELKLYTYLLYKSQERSTLELTIPNEELKDTAGISSNSVRNARQRLRDRNFIRCRQAAGGVYIYTLWNAETDSAFDVNPQENSESGTREHRRGRTRVKQLGDLKPDQYRLYFETRLKGHELHEGKGGSQLLTTCPFHRDHHPSLSINVDHGLWNCFGCEAKGGMIDFEIKLSGCDRKTAFETIATMLNDPELIHSVFDPEAIYPYFDEKRNRLFEIVRFPGKQFLARHYKGRRASWGIDGLRRVLYNLPDVLAATHVIVCEGEKDANRVSGLQLYGKDDLPVAVTTCPFGAGHWQEEFSQSLQGKHVLIMADNDDPGLEHAADVEAKSEGLARSIQVVHDWGPGCKDVSDYLDHHCTEDLLQKTVPDWFSVTPVCEA